ncbi:hypothetical protein [uncultured Aureimonas sp.]|uniref:hypothetical protein n=1 Tax=uncultured Aureimonas sp. TaxID=1604662 RepID=UPI0025D41220|nr:hypothetical protein [uncultured Aureimonas sp.]
MSGPWQMVLPDEEFGEMLALLEAADLAASFHFALEGLTVTTADADAAVLLVLAFGTPGVAEARSLRAL